MSNHLFKSLNDLKFFSVCSLKSATTDEDNSSPLLLLTTNDVATEGIQDTLATALYTGASLSLQARRHSRVSTPHVCVVGLLVTNICHLLKSYHKLCWLADYNLSVSNQDDVFDSEAHTFDNKYVPVNVN